VSTLPSVISIDENMQAKDLMYGKLCKMWSRSPADMLRQGPAPDLFQVRGDLTVAEWQIHLPGLRGARQREVTGLEG